MALAGLMGRARVITMDPSPSGTSFSLAHVGPLSGYQTREKSARKLYPPSPCPHLLWPRFADAEKLGSDHGRVGRDANASGHEVWPAEQGFYRDPMGLGRCVLCYRGIRQREKLGREQCMKGRVRVQR